MNFYKPPPSKLRPGSLPDAPAPAVYAGDFNCWNTDWGYKTTNPYGEYLADWAIAGKYCASVRPEGAPLVHLQALEHRDQPRPGLLQSHRARATPCTAHPGQVPLLTSLPITDHNTIARPVDGGETCPEVELLQG